MIIIPRGKKYKYEEYHKEIDGILFKKCVRHKEFFPNENEWLPCSLEYFFKNISKRQRESGYKLDYDRNNKDNQKLYRNNHRKHDISKTESKAILETFDYSCAYCDMTLSEHKEKYHEKLHDDHVDDNGYNDLRNDVPACKICNTSKHTEDMETWFRRQVFFTEERLQKILWWINEGYKDYIEAKPPYRIVRKQNKGLSTYHFELWAVDEKRNFVNLIYIGNKKKDILNNINKILI